MDNQIWDSSINPPLAFFTSEGKQHPTLLDAYATRISGLTLL